MSDGLQKGILGLVYSALTGEAVTLPEDFDLEQVQPLVKSHQIGNLVYYGAVNCGIDPNLQVMKDLFAVTYKNILIDERQRKALRSVMDAFDANGIHYMPLKGVLLKNMYPKTDMRIMGDGDILIKTEEYDKIRPVMEQQGFTEKKETDHELAWKNPALYLELHKRLIPSYNYDYAAYYGDGWQLGHPTADKPYRYEMTDEDQLVYLFTHFAKHYRDGGIGIRHMLDLYVYRKAKPDMNWRYIAGELEKLQLLAFYENVQQTLGVWFENAPENAITQSITQVIFHSGAYGDVKSHAIAEGVRHKALEGGTSKQTRINAWRYTIFLPYKFMKEKYPVLKNVPVLLPVMWVVRWFQAIFTKPQVISGQRQRLELLQEDKLDAWEAQMHAVGLSFHFEENKK